ncbi:Uncharacterised protein [Mycobacterium tuberculosis]|uniref:Uncharacterized protein n=1 Tax=Mycobacterium tuberculosis TaxID=1773 RepID=A0A654ZIF1_MYCTX|nr:Uncharacterised protein [Mycobacterium tuberculosis]CKO96644.1 Uncharacterised protein [Mycobacterium tuberculosis]CKR64429.1 Uncharacterised protein [Mycobacterium tuberculosis]CKR93864.1 Uncharacterised protein [Mycobacterium tuberculosis]CKS21934.1 Uncharacterised protein [Mycobacterium tuberculosis]
MVGEGAGQCSGRGAERRRGQQCRREQADRQAHPGAPRGAAPAEPISGVDQNRTALGVLADQHRTLQRNAFVLGGIDEGLKIVTSRIEVLIAGDEHQRVVFTHHETPDMCVTAGNRPRLTMLAT